MTVARPAAREETSSVVRAVWAVRLIFAINGFLFASWVSRIPAVSKSLHADPGQLGLALLGVGLGSLLSMPMAGPIIARPGARFVLRVAATGACLAYAVIPFAPSIIVLGVVLLCVGFFYGTWDVAMNVDGDAVERRAGRTLMPGFHAGWSLGSVAGAAIGALVAQLGVGPRGHLPVVAVVVCLATVAASTVLPHGRPEPNAAPPVAARRLLRDPRILMLGAMTFCAAWAEGSANDWLALLLARERDATQAQAAFGFGVFAAAMTIGRLGGGKVVDRFGRVGALRYGAVLAIVGVIVTLTVPGIVGPYLGSVGWGLGIAVAFPLAMSAAGDTRAAPAQAIAVVSTLGYGGFLVGPPALGLLANHVGLGRALWLVVALGVGVALLSRAAPPPTPSGADAHAG
ncbi:MAG: MFS transporter [Actinomycetales bacterium]